MRLVNNNGAVLAQEEVILKLSEEDAVCHELESRVLAHFTVIPHLQAINMQLCTSTSRCRMHTCIEADHVYR